ncbi:MAG: LemA family protein [Candidatus Marsarchaeota archaeon]|nr:LemA family protein [Candidatus Marsarchaeota archaeon]
MSLVETLMLGAGVVAGLVVLFFIVAYNSLVTMRTRIDGSWSQIDVQLKRRFDLVPNLVETVKGYAKHEKDVFTEVTKARAATASAGTMAEKAKADNMLSGTLKSLFAVAENYPQLKANENFKMLQEELSGIESKIAYARQFYNDTVLSYNTAIQTVPTNFVAGAFGFAPREFFKAEGAERENVKVKF